MRRFITDIQTCIRFDMHKHIITSIANFFINDWDNLNYPLKWIVHFQWVKSVGLRFLLTSFDKSRSTSKFSSGFTVASFMDKNCKIYLHKMTSHKIHNIMKLMLWSCVKWLNPSYFTKVFPFFYFLGVKHVHSAKQIKFEL
jgi:hypothetical protein